MLLHLFIQKVLLNTSAAPGTVLRAGRSREPESRLWLPACREEMSASFTKGER